MGEVEIRGHSGVSRSRACPEDPAWGVSTLVVGLIALILCLLQARERRQQWISTHEMFNAACLLTSQATLHTIPPK